MAAPHLPLPRAVCCGLGSFPSTGSLLWLWPCRDQRDTSQCTPTPCACTQVVQGQSTADRGCPSCLSPSVAPRCLPLCRQSWIHADWSQFPSQKSNVSVITSMQVPSCWINVASCNSLLCPKLLNILPGWCQDCSLRAVSLQGSLWVVWWQFYPTDAHSCLSGLS